MKPTVITLVYGLGFGMVLVLLVVPALMAIQTDLSRQRTAMLRGLWAPDFRIRRAVRLCAGLLLLWFAATLGAYASFGGVLPILGGVGDITDTGTVLVLFWSGSAVIFALCFSIAALLLNRHGQPARQP